MGIWRLSRLLFALYALLILQVTSSSFFGANADDGDGANVKADSCPAIGIDLGTTYSCVGVFKEGRVEILANEFGSRITPSYVQYSPDGGVVVGETAKISMNTNSKQVIFDAKRLIGRTTSDPDVKRDRRNWPFGIVERDGKLHISTEGSGSSKKITTPEEVSAAVLSKMKSIAEGYLGTDVCSAVITVPAYFNDAQRQATKDAGAIAGLDVKRIINEPTAAAIAYGLNNKEKGGKATRILVYDLGGGTFDVSILNLQDGMFEVSATGGDTHLGGQDFDNLIMEHIVTKFVAENNNSSEYKPDRAAMAKLRLEVEMAKKYLSTTNNAVLEIPNFYKGKELRTQITRAKFEQLCSSLFDKTISVVDKVIADAKISKSDIDEIVLVGGSTRIPKITEMIERYFNKKPNKGINPDEAVAYGAAIQAAILSNQSHKLIDDVLLLDVTPLTLGIEVHGGMIAPIIPRNSQIPIKKSQIFTTVADNQSTVSIKVYEGERTFSKDNHLLGDFQLTGIPHSQRGVPQIEVSFRIDADGILKVHATDKGTGKSEATIIRNDSGRLTSEQIEKMIESSELNAKKDKEMREAMEAKNELEMLIYTSKGAVSASRSKNVDPSLVAALEKVVHDAEGWLESSNDNFTKDEILEHVKKLSDAVVPISKILYSTSDSSAEKDQGKGGDSDHNDLEDDDLFGEDL